MQRYEDDKAILESYIQKLSYQNIPEVLSSAMRYSLELPGKRLRGVLLLEAYRLLQEDIEKALPFSAAVEMIHCYTLIHDDLPCMDDDDIRRGKPSNHKVFGEGMAVLAGDALLNYAHEIMLDACLSCGDMNTVRATHALSKHAGASGVIAGQSIDISSTILNNSVDTLRYIQQHKTADLLIGSVLAGLFLAGAAQKQLDAGYGYAYHLGLAFQIIDDILDATGESAVLGKSTGKDAAQNKLTWLNMFGLEQSHLDARTHTKLACESIASGFDNASYLVKIAQQFLDRLK